MSQDAELLCSIAWLSSTAWAVQVLHNDAGFDCPTYVTAHPCRHAGQYELRQMLQLAGSSVTFEWSQDSHG